MNTIKPRIKITSRLQRKLKWGVSGCGSFAENSFLPSLQLVKRSKLISVYSHDLDRALFICSKFGGQHAFNNFEDFLKSNFEILYISSANAEHHRQVILAANAGKHILCERPMAINSAQAREMIEACKKNNVLLILNHMHRFHPLVNKAKELINNQIIGKIVSISASYNIDLAPNENFRFVKSLSGGGVLIDLGSQMIDMLRFFGGEISGVKGYKDNVVYKSEVEDFASAIVKFEKGGYGYFNVSYNAKKAFNRVEIIGCKGSISIENFIVRKNKPAKLIIDLSGEGKKVFMKRSGRLTFVQKAVQKIILKNAPPPVTGEDGLKNLEIIEEIERQCL